MCRLIWVFVTRIRKGHFRAYALKWFGVLRFFQHYFFMQRPSRDDWLIVLGFNDTSTLEGHFVSSPREREKRDRRESRGDEREGQGRKRNRNESEETEEIKTFPSTLTHYKDSRPCPTVSQYQLDAPVVGWCKGAVYRGMIKKGSGQ